MELVKWQLKASLCSPTMMGKPRASHLSPVARQQQSITGSAFFAEEKEADSSPLVLPVIATLCPASVHLDVMIPQGLLSTMSQGQDPGLWP
jgi:hypothetical protein